MLNFGVFNSRSQMPNCPQERLSWFTLPLAGCESSYFLFSILLKRKTICIWYQHSFFFFFNLCQFIWKTHNFNLYVFDDQWGWTFLRVFVFLFIFLFLDMHCLFMSFAQFSDKVGFFFWWHLLYLYVLYTSCKYFYQFLIHILLWWFKNFCLFHFSLWCYDKLL